MTNYNLKEHIPELLLLNGPLTKNELKELIMVNNSEIKRISDKSMSESILNLLKRKKIEISGYKFQTDKGRMQSIKVDNLIFGVVKELYFEISVIIVQLNSKDPSEVKKSYYELQKLFRKRYVEYQHYYQNICKEFKEKIKKIKIEVALSEIDTLIKQPLKIKEQKDELKIIKQELLMHSPDHHIWMVSSFKNPKMNHLINDDGKIVRVSEGILIDKDHDFTKDEILGHFLPYHEKILCARSLKEIDELFEKIIGFLEIDRTIKNHVLLAKSLSNDRKSLSTFGHVLRDLWESEWQDMMINDTKEFKWWECD